MHLKLGQFENAIADYDAALRRDEKKASSLYGRGLAKRKTGDNNGGNTDIAAATAIKRDIAGEFHAIELSEQQLKAGDLR